MQKFFSVPFRFHHGVMTAPVSRSQREIITGSYLTT